MEYFLKVLKSWNDFKSRSRRKEYWMFFLCNVVLGIITGVIDSILGIQAATLIVSLVLLVPGLAVAVRRMHDIGKSGWMLLIGLIPLVGGLIVLYWSCQPGQLEDNQWGKNPKLVEDGVQL